MSEIMFANGVKYPMPSTESAAKSKPMITPSNLMTNDPESPSDAKRADFDVVMRIVGLVCARIHLLEAELQVCFNAVWSSQQLFPCHPSYSRRREPSGYHL